MNIFHSFFESLYKRTVREAKLRSIFVLFFCFTRFTLFAFKSLIIIIENFQKYHRIQHRNAQRVVIMNERNKLL